MVQITRTSICRQIRNSAPFFVTPWPTSRTLEDLLDVLRLHARCSQAMSNLQILETFDFPRALPTHLIRVPKEGLALRLPILLRGWATPTLKSFKLCLKHAHIRKLWKTCVGDNFCPTMHTVCRPKAGHFLECFHNCYFISTK